MSKQKDLSHTALETQLLHAGTLRSQYGEVSEAIFLNSGFCYDSAHTAEKRFNGEEPGFVYSRYLNPTLKMLEDRLVALEKGAEAACVMASGMAAVHASLMCFLKTGDHVVANRVLFGSCYYIITEILNRFGITYTLVDDTSDLGEWKAAMADGCAAVFIESPANPTLGITDIAEVSKLAHAKGARVIVDNVFATPLYQSPLELGADVVVYSTTKHMDGQGRVLGGCVLGSTEYITETLLPYHRHTGPAMSPFTAWLLLKSLETFTLRMQRHTENAQKVAEWLGQHSQISRVFYPGLPSHPHYAIAQKQMTGGSALIAFEVKGGKEAAFAMMNRLNLITISNNLGDGKSLVTHPATTTHSNIDAATRQEIGITDGIVRFSVGLEHADDLIADLQQALQ
ncbi:MAG: O-succinylhomoserine sulfhydrylase [Rickettsiales bacterium]|nr:O-succinylhomoserine sulfhydrylase [Rickettsiales bacterium]|tara:strand:+ start:1054 stop:2247 length:1194 start_codon:yes stop_codon:yes gene_type:complete